jgi:LPS export ABC transporter permease LptF/LPS export ABC transporter permease LptG
MRLLSRIIFREILTTSVIGVVMFTFVIFLHDSRPLFEFLVRNSGTPTTVAYLFALVLPRALQYTIPLSVLIGALLTLSRMSSDGEITAMRAAGVPGRRVVPAIFGFGMLGTLAAAAATLWLVPWSMREFYRVENQVLGRQLTADVQPRVFEEQFPNWILYVNDVIIGQTPRWKRVFMADVTPPEERKAGAADRGDNPRIMLAADALAVPDAAHNRVQLNLRNGITYEPDKNDEYQISTAPTGDQGLEASKPKEERNAHPSTEMDTIPLYRRAYLHPTPDLEQLLDERIELHRRLALPLACVLLALAGVPLGITSRRAGKSGAIVLTVAIGIIYFIGLISCSSLARQGTLPPGIAIWIPDAVFAVFGIVSIMRLEKPGDRDIIGAIMRLLPARETPAPKVRARDRFGPRVWVSRFPLLPEIIDTYVLTSFVFYFLLLLITFVLIFHVFTFFELLSDIIKNHPSMTHVVLNYHLFLTPLLVYEMTPLAVLAAVLVCFGVLTKHNEVTAFKACGISVYRLSVPVLVMGLALSAGLFVFDYKWLPEWDRRQDALRNQIKGKAPQTYQRADRKWVYVREHDRVYYYKYLEVDARSIAMADVNVYEIDPVQFRLTKHIWAERARWEPSLDQWVFENGRSWEMNGECATCGNPHLDNFAGKTKTFPELEEKPDYFVHEVKQSRQMNFEELQGYIGELQHGGFDTIPLQVQLQKKFSVPLFALIMAMVSIPFAFLTGNRGAMAGVGLSLGIAIAYWSIGQLFEQVGNLNQLPPGVAAWSPDVIFSLAGLYFLARMRT